MGAPTTREVLGAAHLDQPRKTVAEARQTERGPRPPRPDVHLVHGKFWHEGPERGHGVVRGTRRV